MRQYRVTRPQPQLYVVSTAGTEKSLYVNGKREAAHAIVESGLPTVGDPKLDVGDTGADRGHALRRDPQPLRVGVAAALATGPGGVAAVAVGAQQLGVDEPVGDVRQPAPGIAGQQVEHLLGARRREKDDQEQCDVSR